MNKIKTTICLRLFFNSPVTSAFSLQGTSEYYFILTYLAQNKQSEKSLLQGLGL